MGKFSQHSDMDIAVIMEGIAATNNSGAKTYTFSELEELQRELINRHMNQKYINTTSSLMRDMIENGTMNNSELESPTVPTPQSIYDDSVNHFKSESNLKKPEKISAFPNKKITPEPLNPRELSKNMPMEKTSEEVLIIEEDIIIEPEIKQSNLEDFVFNAPPAPLRLGLDGKVEKTSNSIRSNEEKNEFPTLSFLIPFFKVIAWLTVGCTALYFAFLIANFYLGNPTMIVILGVITILSACLEMLFFYAIAEILSWKVKIYKLLNEKLR